MADENRGAAAETWDPSAQASFKNAVKHFNRFIDERLKEPDGKDIAVQLFGTESPENASYDLSKKHCIDVKLMNHFAFYLANSARHLNNITKKLEFNTADRYLSSIKTGISRDLLYNDPSPLTNEKMKIILTGMTNIFVEQAMANNRSLSKSHTTPCFEDIARVCLVSVWLNDFKFANFTFFVLSLLQFAGRGTEAAGLPFSRTVHYRT